MSYYRLSLTTKKAQNILFLMVTIPLSALIIHNLKEVVKDLAEQLELDYKSFIKLIFNVYCIRKIDNIIFN